jgi:peptide/nickel transport system permease protein
MANGRFQRVLEGFRGNLLARICAAVLAAMVLAAVFAFLSPYDPDEINLDSLSQAPSAAHWFGTDELGRDYLTRSLYGGRVSLAVGLLSMLISTSIGLVVGTIAGFVGGFLDNLLMRGIDVLSSIPWMILVTVVSLYLTPGLGAIVIVIGFFTWMQIARLVRAEALSIKEREYVLYAIAAGQRPWRIIAKHIVPSVMPTVLVASSMGIANAIMIESSLSFLGLGVKQPMASWGSMLQSAQGSIETAPQLAIIPGLFIVATVFCFNKVADILRLYVEPKSGS